MPSGSELGIGVVLPEVLGTYSDAGNAAVLAQRARWRGLGARVVDLAADRPPATHCDLYVIGGGEDSAQRFAADWLRRHTDLRTAMAGSAVTFAVCAGLQILGRDFADTTGYRHAGAELLDLTTEPRPRRAVGELVARAHVDGVDVLTGFENHRGATTLGPSVRPLATVEHGVGNGSGPQDATEGAVHGRILATYLHGPVLARNPTLADHLLRLATGADLPGVTEPPDLDRLRRNYLERRATRRTGARRWAAR